MLSRATRSTAPIEIAGRATVGSMRSAFAVARLAGRS
jgi:hypothetical protein